MDEYINYFNILQLHTFVRESPRDNELTSKTVIISTIAYGIRFIWSFWILSFSCYPFNPSDAIFNHLKMTCTFSHFLCSLYPFYLKHERVRGADEGLRRWRGGGKEEDIEG